MQANDHLGCQPDRELHGAFIEATIAKDHGHYLASSKNLGAVFGHTDVPGRLAEDVYRYLVSKGPLHAHA